MLAALLLSALAVGPAPAVTPPNDPSIELWINNDRRFMPGEDAQVQVRTQEDGYLVVLHADPDGRVHVLFPIDPDDDNFVHGGKRYEIRDRAGRDAFEASITGHGTVYAAISHDPFDFTRYNSGNHWDYQALAPNRLSGDPEAALTDLVRGMARSNFDYDVLGYDVIERIYASYRPYRHWAVDPLCDPFYHDYFCRPYYDGYGSYLSISVTFGRPYRGYYYGGYDPFYDPYYYYYRPYAYTYPYRYYSTYWYAPRRPYRGPSRVHGDFVFDNYRDRRNSVGRVDDGYHWPLVRTRDAGVSGRRADGAATAPAARPARPAIDRRPAEGRVVDARPADRSVGRRPDDRPVEAHRARPRDDRDATPRARPNIESRPAERSRPQGRRAERSGGDSRREGRARPESRPSRRDDQPRAEPRRRDDGDGGGHSAEPERRGGDGGDSRPVDRGGRDGGWGGGDGGGRRR